MKALRLLIVAGLATFTWTSCERANARYLDLSTGEMVLLERDEETGDVLNAETGKPVKLYVNTRTNDTIWGPTGEVVNNELRRNKAGTELYVFSDEEDKEYKLEIERDGDYTEKYGDGEDEYKLKVDNDGEYKLKRGAGKNEYKEKMDDDGEYKIKRGDDYKVKRTKNEYKIKRGDYKKEVERDGDVKIKNGNVKIKIDGETGKRTVKVDD